MANDLLTLGRKSFLFYWSLDLRENFIFCGLDFQKSFDDIE